MVYESTLAHHGILGMKWGVRRYQNEDGSLTPRGKKRYSEDPYEQDQASRRRGLSSGTKTALKAGAVVVGSAVALVGAYKLSEATNLPSKLAGLGDRLSKNLDEFKNSQTTQMLVNAGKKMKDSKATKALGNTIGGIGRSMAQAALASVGAIGVAKVAEKYSDSEDDTEAQRNIKQITRDTLSAGIKTATSAQTSAKSSSNGNQNLPRNISSVVGEPKRKTWGAEEDKQYNQLMNDLRDNPDLKAVIKTMRKSEYGMDQMLAYARGAALNHSAIAFRGYWVIRRR